MNMYDLVVEQVWLNRMFVGLLETLAKAKLYPVVIVLLLCISPFQLCPKQVQSEGQLPGWTGALQKLSFQP